MTSRERKRMSGIRAKSQLDITLLNSESKMLPIQILQSSSLSGVIENEQADEVPKVRLEVPKITTKVQLEAHMIENLGT